MVTVTADRTKLVVESAEAVLGLHWFVARDYLAKDEGLEFEIITPGIKTKFELTDPRRRDHHLVSAQERLQRDCRYVLSGHRKLQRRPRSEDLGCGDARGEKSG